MSKKNESKPNLIKLVRFLDQKKQKHGSTRDFKEYLKGELSKDQVNQLSMLAEQKGLIRRDELPGHRYRMTLTVEAEEYISEFEKDKIAEQAQLGFHKSSTNRNKFQYVYIPVAILLAVIAVIWYLDQLLN